MTNHPVIDEFIIYEMLMAFIDGAEGNAYTNYAATQKDENGMRNVLALLVSKGYGKIPIPPAGEQPEWAADLVMISEIRSHTGCTFRSALNAAKAILTKSVPPSPMPDATIREDVDQCGETRTTTRAAQVTTSGTPARDGREVDIRKKLDGLYNYIKGFGICENAADFSDWMIANLSPYLSTLPAAAGAPNDRALQAVVKDIIAGYRWGENLHETTVAVIDAVRRSNASADALEEEHHYAIDDTLSVALGRVATKKIRPLVSAAGADKEDGGAK